MVFRLVLYLAERPRLDFNNGSEDNSNCGCILGPWHLFGFDLNNDPSPGNSSLGSDGSTSVTPDEYNNCPRLDFNNCPWDNLNNSRIFTHWHLFVSDSNKGPPKVFAILVK